MPLESRNGTEESGDWAFKVRWITCGWCKAQFWVPKDQAKNEDQCPKCDFKPRAS